MEKTYNIMITNDEFDSETILTKLTAGEADTFIHSQCEWTDGLCWTIEASNPCLKNCNLVSGTGMFTVSVVEVTLMPGDTTYIAKVIKY